MGAADDLKVAAEAMPHVRLLRGDAVELESIQWLWDGYLPRGLMTTLGGAPGCGKTTIAMSLAGAITSGGVLPDGYRCGTPGDVVIWSGEDPPAVPAPRLIAAGADMQRVQFVDGLGGAEGETAFDPARDMDLLVAAVERLDSPRLLILDPVVSAVAGDSHQNGNVRRGLQPVVDLAQRTGMAVLGITHFSKGTANRDPVERIAGSIGFAALSRLVLVAAKGKPEPGNEGEAPHLLMRAKSNVGPDTGGFAYTLRRDEVAPGIEGQRIVWGEALEGSARDLLAEAEADSDQDEAASASDDAADYLRDLLKGSDASPSRDATRAMKAEGYSDKVIRRAREKLRVIVRREGSGKTMRSLWSLPLVPSFAIPAHTCPSKSMGINGHECASEGTNAAPYDDVEVF
jgi:putative DNA primase/helicase